MAKKKSVKETLADASKTVFEKIGEQASHLKDELKSGKDHFVEFAEEKIASVKTSIKDFQDRNKKTAKKKAAKKSAVKKSPAKKVAKKSSGTTGPKKKKAAVKVNRKAPKKTPSKKSGRAKTAKK